MIFELEGFEVFAVGSAEEAVKAVAGDSFDAVILDIGLPGADGWWFLDEIRRTSAYDSRRVVVVTAHVSPTSPARAIKYGARYIAKPFQAQDIVTAVETAAAGH